MVVGRIRQCKARQAHVPLYHLKTRGKREHVHTYIGYTASSLHSLIMVHYARDCSYTMYYVQ